MQLASVPTTQLTILAMVLWLSSAMTVDLILTSTILFGLLKTRTGWHVTDRVSRRLLLGGNSRSLPARHLFPSLDSPVSASTSHFGCYHSGQFQSVNANASSSQGLLPAPVTNSSCRPSLESGPRPPILPVQNLRRGSSLPPQLALHDEREPRKRQHERDSFEDEGESAWLRLKK